MKIPKSNNALLWTVFVMVSMKDIYFAPFQKRRNVRVGGKEQIQEVGEVVETASNKMSAVPELNLRD